MSGTRRFLPVACFLLVLAVTGGGAFADDLPDWIVVDYSAIVDRRELSHSGESVGELLRRLGGRGLPAPGERPGDRALHGLLEPLVEPYGFVLSDALDSLRPMHDPPRVEVGSLWQPGEVQPAWVELLRARRYLVESDGAGELRALLPWSGDTGAEGSRSAAREAWDEAWPILRHVLAAEARRLAKDESSPPTLRVDVHAYRHLPELSAFRLGTQPERVTVEDTRPRGDRPPLRISGLKGFLESGLRLEGARLDGNGALRLLGSQSRERLQLDGRPLSLADFAVAYRAVFHGGLAEPYMSLDRGYSPQSSLVTYGGRLRDTALGRVSLLCDIRFKTFSVGLDIVLGRDLREQVRAELPGFASHLERFAVHPEARGLSGQQTRLWFYPDEVDMTLSAQGDVFVMRKVRMSAASERLEEGGAASGERPWTRETVDAINGSYDALAGFFPEMAELDQVVRLLSLFSWLKAIETGGLVLPELDSLLALELPELTTPRVYPQLLAFNALPPEGGDGAVEAFDRVEVAEALDRLGPADGRPLSARRRFQRAMAALDPQQPDHAALIQRAQGLDVGNLDDDRLDLMAHEAERVRMHQLVLATLGEEQRAGLAERFRSGEQLRIFSVGIGGLDLGMDQVLARAGGRSLGLTGAAERPTGSDPIGPVSVPGPTEEWRRDPRILPAIRIPAHGVGAGEDPGNGSRIATGGGAEEGRWVLAIYGQDGPEVRTRKVRLDPQRRVTSIERVEQLRSIRYDLKRSGDGLTARPVPSPVDTVEPSAPARPPQGLVLLQIDAPAEGALESKGIPLKLVSPVRSLEAEFPRKLLQRLVLGRKVDAAAGQPLSGLAPLPDPLGPVLGVMVLAPERLGRPPWEVEPPLLPGEENPFTVARALDAWWKPEGPSHPGASVGTDPALSPARWAGAPNPGADALLWLPDELDPALDGKLEQAWSDGRLSREAQPKIVSRLVLLISDAPPARFARRLRQLASDPQMDGRLLAALSLAGPIRSDLAASLLAEGRLAGLGLASASVVSRRHVAEEIAEMRSELVLNEGRLRIEQLPGPFVWHF